MRTGLNNLPEPTDLHALLSGQRPLDWGDPIPTKKEIAAQYGDGTAARSLGMLTKASADSDSTERDFTMTRLFLVKDVDVELWVAALVEEDLWTYVGNTGKFHCNEGARHDYYFLNGMQYVDIGIAEAERLIRAGVGTVDEEELPDAVRRWREDSKGMDPEVVFASMVADLT